MSDEKFRTVRILNYAKPNPTTMTLDQIHERIESLLETIKYSGEDQDLFFNSEMEMAYLEQVREQLEESN